MSQKRDRPAPAKGSTRTDLRLTKAPADTPRGRLHRLAAVGTRVGQGLKVAVRLDRDDMTKMRRLAQRGVDLLRTDDSRGGRLLARLCYGLDLSIGALMLIGDLDIAALGDGLTLTLVQLEVAEGTIRDLQSKLRAASGELRFEREHNEKLRADLAANHARFAVVMDGDGPAETWESEPTRNSTLPGEMARALSESDEP